MTAETQAGKKPQSNLHDEFAKSVFSEIANARGLLRSYLPERLSRHLNWSTLRLERDSFSSGELVGEYADLLFSVRLKGSSLRQRIRLLFEHKRRPDKETPRQLMRYIHRQFEQTESGKPLPCIVTVLLLQSGRCSHGSLSSEYQLPNEILADLSPFMLDFKIVTIELSQLDEDHLLGNEFGRFALAAMKAVGEGHPGRTFEFERILRDLCSRVPEADAEREIRRGLYYLTSALGPAQEQELRSKMVAAKATFGPLEEKAMTLLDVLEKRGEERGIQIGIEQGLEQGIEQGIEKGIQLGQRKARIELLMQLLRRLSSEFVDADAALLEKLSDQGLDAVTDAYFQQQSLSEIRKLMRRSRLRSDVKSSRRSK